MTRRSFAATCAAAASSPAAPAPKLGIDLFSIRSLGWNPFEYLDYCAKWGARVVHFSEIRFLGNLQPDHLKKVRAHAQRLGIELEIGMRSICPTSKLFDPSQGAAEEQLSRMVEAADHIGARLIRAFLGSSADRAGPLPIEAHIENTVKVLRNVRSQVMDHNLKVAVENHSGDMQARELKMLIEAAGKDFVGACIDSGNPCWTIEDPHLTLEVLHPYVLTSHIRDSYLWATPEGAAVRWVRLGEGNVDMDGWIRKYLELCPGKALSLEILVYGPRMYPYRKPEFWNAYRSTPAWEFMRFLKLVEAGKPLPPQPPVPKDQAAQREREDLEASLKHVKKLLGMS
jgi:sugar phosphate isomerase/epimerase